MSGTDACVLLSPFQLAVRPDCSVSLRFLLTLLFAHFRSSMVVVQVRHLRGNGVLCKCLDALLLVDVVAQLGGWVSIELAVSARGCFLHSQVLYHFLSQLCFTNSTLCSLLNCNCGVLGSWCHVLLRARVLPPGTDLRAVCFVFVFGVFSFHFALLFVCTCVASSCLHGISFRLRLLIAI